MLTDTAKSYSYNAEGHLTSIPMLGISYLYDGDGKRVIKSNGTLYWYGMSSDPLDETDSAGDTNNSSFFEYVFFGGKRIARRDYQNNVNYYFSDHLGTSRVVTNSTGSILDDSDFYPFGGERAVASSSGNHYKFTGKERDPESGLDDFGARFDSPSLGRFMSIDPIVLHPQKMLDPQEFNLYSYVRDNPLKFADPTGEIVNLYCLAERQRQELLDELEKDTGLTLKYNSDTGDLETVGDPSKATGGSATYRSDLLAAISSKDEYTVANATTVDGKPVIFGAYDPKHKTLYLDFVDFSKPHDAVTLGITFYHELIGHGLKGLPDARDADAIDLWSGNNARDVTLKISRELGLREIRDDHIYEGPQKGKYYIITHEPLKGSLLWQNLTFHDMHIKKVDVTDAAVNR